MVAKENRYESYGKSGDMNELMKLITSECNGFEYTEIVKNLPSWISMLTTEKQKTVLQLHYFKQLSIMEIRFQMGFVSNRDVERCLDGAKKKLIKIIKQFEEA